MEQDSESHCRTLDLMAWRHGTTFGGLAIALAVLVAWQWDEYGHECDRASETVANTADSVMNALVGGVRSHRRLGLFFSDSIQGVLDGLASANGVRAVALVSEDGAKALVAGQKDLLNLTPPFAPSERWTDAGFLSIRTFNLPAEMGGPGGGLGSGFGGGRGGGRGAGLRGGMGASSHRPTDNEDAAASFLPNETVAVFLLLDRQQADEARDRAAWLRGFIVLAGSLAVVCIALVWRATVRLAESREREKSLAAESRHFRDLSQAAAGLAHETRNPLGLIRGWTQRMADGGVESAEARRQAHAVIEECDRVTARINQFLAFARPSHPKLDRFDAAEVVGELALLLDPDLIAKQATVQYATPGLAILADREMLREALFNLMQNAVQASPIGGVVEVTMTKEAGGKTRIAVADQGPGVPDDSVDRLFTPYHTTRENGTGLGLAIVRRIAMMHGWQAGYTPRGGGGSVFWLAGIPD